MTRFYDYHGFFDLTGFGRLEKGHLKMGWSGGLHPLRPVWKKRDILTDSQYFILFNDENERWELHELKPPFSSLTVDHIFCEIGLMNQMFLFTKIV